MRWTRVGRWAAAGFVVAAGSAVARASDTVSERPRVPAPLPHRARLPARLELNRGQAPRGWDLVARGAGCRAVVRSDQIALACGDDVLRIHVDLAPRAAPDVRGFETEGRAHYLIGPERAWVRDVPMVSGAVYRDAAAGRAWSVAARGDAVEFACALPGEEEPVLRLEGCEALRVADDGALRAEMPAGVATLGAPVAWQVTEGGRRPVAASYSVGADGVVTIELGDRDPRRTTFVDPTLDYVSYLGGNADDAVRGMAFDSAGTLLLAGHTFATNFPVTSGAYQGSIGNAATRSDWFVGALASSGTAFAWCTYLGGDRDEGLFAFGLDSADRPVVVGTSVSTNLPTTPGVLSAGPPSSCAWAKLSANGSSVVLCSYAPTTLLTNGRGCVAPDGSLHLLSNVGVSCVSADATQVLWTTRLTPTSTIDVQSSTIWAVAADGASNAFVVGSTNQTNFTITSGSYQTQLASSASDAVIVKVGRSNGAVVWSSLLGGTASEAGRAVALDDAGRPVVTGDTTSNNFPTTAGAFQSLRGGQEDAFVSRLSSDGRRLELSTFYGGGGADSGLVVRAHPVGAIFLGGTTTSTDLPLERPLDDSFAGGSYDGFLAHLDSTGDLATATYFGGSALDDVTALAVDPDGGVAVGGTTYSSGVATSGAYQTSAGSTVDGWFARISGALGGTVDGLSVTPRSLPEWTSGVAFSQALAAGGATGSVTWTVQSGTVPPGLALGSSGTLSGTPTQAGTYAFVARATDSAGVGGVTSLSLTVNPAVAVTTASLPAWTRNVPFDTTLAATGGTGAKSFTLVGGALPAGLSLGLTGRLQGTPSQGETQTFTVRATDAVGGFADRTLTLRINASLVITSGPPPTWTTGRPWAANFAASGGTPPLTWSLVAGDPPVVGDVVPGTGALQGIAEGVGSYAFTVRVSDARGAFAQQAYDVAIVAPPSVGTATLPLGAVGRPYAARLSAADGTPPGVWSLDSPSFPPGMTLATDDGRLSGTPTAPFDGTLGLVYTDAAGAAASASLPLRIGEPLDLRLRRAKATPDADGRALAYLELTAGTRLDVLVRGGGAGRSGPSVVLVDASGAQVDLGKALRANGKGARLQGFAVAETGRYFLDVTPAEGARRPPRVDVAIAPAPSFAGTVAVSPTATPSLVEFAAPPGARVTVEARPAKGTGVVPSIVGLLDADDADLLATGTVTSKRGTSRFTSQTPLAGGDYRVLLSGGETSGPVVWKVRLKLPRTYDFALPDLAAGGEDE